MDGTRAFRRSTPQGGNVTFDGWQVTLCDPMWHVSSHSGVATLRTAIHLLLTYLRYFDNGDVIAAVTSATAAWAEYV